MPHIRQSRPDSGLAFKGKVLEIFQLDFGNENGSSQGQNLAVTGLCIPGWLDSDPVGGEEGTT